MVGGKDLVIGNLDCPTYGVYQSLQARYGLMENHKAAMDAIAGELMG